MAMLRVGGTVAGWAPGVRRMPSRIRFHWITWSGAGAEMVAARGAALAANALPTLAAAVMIAPIRKPSANNRKEKRLMSVLLCCRGWKCGLEGSGPLVEVVAAAGVEDGERVLASGEEDAA